MGLVPFHYRGRPGWSRVDILPTPGIFTTLLNILPGFPVTVVAYNRGSTSLATDVPFSTVGSSVGTVRG